VLAVDRPGHGLADPYDYRGVDLLDHARTFLEQILDAEKLESVPVVASSMGGLWAVSFAIAQPRRVSRLVLAGATAGITRALPLQMRLGTLPVLKGMIRDLMRKPTRDAVRAFWKQMLVAHPERLADDFLDLSAASQQRNVESWFTLIDQSYDFWGMRAQLLLGEHWKNLTVPTTFIWGDKDAFSPPEVGEAVVAANPRIRMVRIPDAGHAPWMDEPDKVLAAINGALA
jgi:pimeloyl-ACP methyl ester carboxylesterase